jgi:hypothetical protein
VLRDAGLKDVHTLDNAADCALPRPHRLDDAKTGWVRESLKQVNLFHRNSCDSLLTACEGTQACSRATDVRRLCKTVRASDLREEPFAREPCGAALFSKARNDAVAVHARCAIAGAVIRSG